MQDHKTDPYVFRLMNDETVILMAAVHVDDLFVIGGGKELLSSTTL